MAKITKGAVDRAGTKAKPYEIRGQAGLILRVQPTGKKTYYVQIRRGRRERIGDADVITLARAEYRAREILNEAHDYGDPVKRDIKKSTLGGFVESTYAPWLRANRRRAEKTLHDLERLKRGFENLYAKRLTDITNTDLDQYVAARREQGISAATVLRDLNNLQSVMRLAREKRYLRESPFKDWRKPKADDLGKPRYLSDEEEDRLRKALAARDEKTRRERESANKWRAERGYELLPKIGANEYPDHMTPMALVSINTGLRYGELAALEWPAIDFRAKVLTVTGRTAKGAKTRHVPLNAEALDVLRRWRAQGDGAGLVFRNGEGERIASLKTAWAKLLKDARIKDFRWHDLRHTFASKLVQRGVDLPVVRELLGHGDFALTLRYAHLKPGQTADAVARLAA
jgi:site-specific recombinase XerD